MSTHLLLLVFVRSSPNKVGAEDEPARSRRRPVLVGVISADFRGEPPPERGVQQVAADLAVGIPRNQLSIDRSN